MIKFSYLSMFFHRNITTI